MTAQNPLIGSSALILSPSSEPFPRKLVDKVRSGQFVEMRELLADNISLLRQLESVQGPTHMPLIGPNRPRLREVSSLSSWVYCFLGYVAILTTDSITRDQLAYARLIIREAQRHGGSGWQDYDRSFREQVAADPAIRWNTLVPGLHAATILGQANSQGTAFCTLCRGSDHARSQCALAYLFPQPPRAATQPTQITARVVRCSGIICKSWNKGACILPGNCGYRHVCITCQQQHKARDCPTTPDTSFYKQGIPARVSTLQPATRS